MAGKQHKREAKRAREAARAQARRQERQRTIQTALIVLIAVVIGGVVIFLSLDDAAEVAGDEAATEADEADEAAATEGATPEPSVSASPQPAVAACDPAPAPDNALAAGESKPTFPDGPERVLDEQTGYRAVIETSCGAMVFQLLEDDAPQTVNSFVFLAQQGFFDGLEIFRNSPGIAILQTGAGDNQNTFDIGYTLPDELGRAEAEGGYGPGALALANAGPDTGGSQFFMVYDQTDLPPDYTLFGQLVEGLDVLRSIGAIPTEEPGNPRNETPSETVYLESVTIETFPQEPVGPLAPVETPAAGPGASPDPVTPTAAPPSPAAVAPVEPSMDPSPPAS